MTQLLACLDGVWRVGEREGGEKEGKEERRKEGEERKAGIGRGYDVN